MCCVEIPTHTSTNTHPRAHTPVRPPERSHIHTHAHKHARARTHTHTHTHTLSLSFSLARSLSLSISRSISLFLSLVFSLHYGDKSWKRTENNVIEASLLGCTSSVTLAERLVVWYTLPEPKFMIPSMLAQCILKET